MNTKDFENKFINFNGRIYFNYSLKKLNWFNIGGSAKIYFKPHTLQDLIEFLKLSKDEENFFVIGAAALLPEPPCSTSTLNAYLGSL